MKLELVKAGQRPPFPVVAHFHAVLMGGFLLFLLCQTVLMTTGRGDLHRRIGPVAFLLAPALIVVGFLLASGSWHGVWHAAHDGPMEIRAAMLDFDGVILESVEVKTEAFRSLFAGIPDHVDEIVEYHRQNTGVSRFDKFRHIYASILNRDLTAQEFDRLSTRYHDLVIGGVLAAPFVAGAPEFLERFSPRIPLYVVSASPEEELGDIMAQRDLGRYFRGIFGAPRRKVECIRSIMDTERLDPSRVLFVGDALNDYRAAREAGVPFAGRLHPGEPDRFSGKEGIVTVVDDLDGLGRFLENRIC
jgi:phosphoglycolate phosphatase-like HAD superfamily hydrolase